jgi:gamma-glutamylcysteine synthetase
MVSFFDLLDAFPSLSDAPRELEQLSTWFDSAGPTEQATHAAALVLELAGTSEVTFSEAEALHAWDERHQAAYEQLRRRIAAEGLERQPAHV